MSTTPSASEVEVEQVDRRRSALIDRIGTFADLLCSDPLPGAFGDVAYDLLRQAAAQMASDSMRLAERSRFAGEPVAWGYELATGLSNETGQYAVFGAPRVSTYRPNVPEGSIRNLTPLYALTPQPEKRDDKLTMTVRLTAEEQRVLEELAAKKDLPPSRVFIQGLRLYQMQDVGLVERVPEKREGLREAGRFADLELTEDGYSLRTPYDGDADGDGRPIVVGGEILATFTDSDEGEKFRDFVIAALRPTGADNGEGK